MVRSLFGTFICWVHGAKYSGDFKNGKKHGNGKYNFPNGDVYEGEWENGKREGEGIYTYFSGKKADKGLFKNNKYIGEKR